MIVAKFTRLLGWLSVSRQASPTFSIAFVGPRSQRTNAFQKIPESSFKMSLLQPNTQLSRSIRVVQSTFSLGGSSRIRFRNRGSLSKSTTAVLAITMAAAFIVPTARGDSIRLDPFDVITVTPDSHQAFVRSIHSFSLRRLRCATLGAPVRCFGRKRRMPDCCAPAGLTAGRSGDFDQDDPGTLGAYAAAPNPIPLAIAAHSMTDSVTPVSGVPGTPITSVPGTPVSGVPVSSVPGPIAGAGVPGLLLLGCGLFGWWRYRQAQLLTCGRFSATSRPKSA
jgi:hypothetical protein